MATGRRRTAVVALLILGVAAVLLTFVGHEREPAVDGRRDASDRVESERARSRGTETPDAALPHGPLEKPVEARADERQSASLRREFRGVVIDPDRNGGALRAEIDVRTSGGRTIAPSECEMAPDGTFRLLLHVDHSEGALSIGARDPASGRTSARFQCEVAEGEDDRWVVLILREPAELTGRVVSAAGDPTAGVRVTARCLGKPSVAAWNASEANPTIVSSVSDASGRFVLTVPRLPGRVVVHDASATVRSPTHYDATDRDAVDVGDLVFDASSLVRWRLRVVDSSSRPCAGVVVRADFDTAACLHRDPRFDEETSTLRLEPDGLFDIVAARRAEPILLAVGSPTHVTRSVGLPCDVAGEHRFDLVLEPRATVDLRVVSVGRELAADVPLEFDLQPAAESAWPESVSEPVDVRSGRPLSVETGRIVPPGEWLESDFAYNAVVPLGEHRYRLHRIVPGTSRLTVYFNEQVVHDGPVRFAGRGEPTSVRVEIPGGRMLTVDVGAVERWTRAQGATTWFEPWGLWVARVDPERIANGATGNDARRTLCALRLAGGGGRPPSGPLRVWVPDDVDVLGFAFLYRPLGRRERPVPARDVVFLPVPTERDAVIVAPAPESPLSGTARIEIVASMGERDFPRAGVPIDVVQIRDRSSRPDAPNGSCAVRTDARGRAVLRVFPGWYAIHADPSFGKSGVERFSIAEGESRVVRIELEFPR